MWVAPVGKLAGLVIGNAVGGDHPMRAFDPGCNLAGIGDIGRLETIAGGAGSTSVASRRLRRGRCDDGGEEEEGQDLFHGRGVV